MVWVFKTGHHTCFLYVASWRAWPWLSNIITYPRVIRSKRVLRLTILLAPCGTRSVIITHCCCCKCWALVWQASCRLHRWVLALLISYSLFLVMSFVITSLLLLETAIANSTSTPFNISPQLRFPRASTTCGTLWWVASDSFLLG